MLVEPDLPLEEIVPTPANGEGGRYGGVVRRSKGVHNG